MRPEMAAGGPQPAGGRRAAGLVKRRHLLRSRVRLRARTHRSAGPAHLRSGFVPAGTPCADAGPCVRPGSCNGAGTCDPSPRRARRVRRNAAGRRRRIPLPRVLRRSVHGARREHARLPRALLGVHVVVGVTPMSLSRSLRATQHLGRRLVPQQVARVRRRDGRGGFNDSSGLRRSFQRSGRSK